MVAESRNFKCTVDVSLNVNLDGESRSLGVSLEVSLEVSLGVSNLGTSTVNLGTIHN